MSNTQSGLSPEQQLALCRTQFSNADIQTQHALHCCELGFNAMQRGDYGVAALLLSEEGECLLQAENRVFSKGYTPAAHAEMCLMDQYQSVQAVLPPPEKLTLISLLEPCPMCFGRILLSGIGRVQYLVPDPDGGSAAQPSGLPPAWRNLSQLCAVERLDLPDSLFQLARNIAFAQQQALRHKLMQAIRSGHL